MIATHAAASCESHDDLLRIAMVKAKFRHRGIEIDFHHGRDRSRTAAMRPASYGTATYGVGDTRADAIENAWRMHTNHNERPPPEETTLLAAVPPAVTAR